MRHTAGAATQLDLFKVQVEVTTARTSQIIALHAYSVSVAQLQRATGPTEVEVAEPLPPTISP